MTAGATWIRHIHSQEIIKEILDYCAEEKKSERGKVLDEVKERLSEFLLTTDSPLEETGLEIAIKILTEFRQKDGE